MSELGNVFDAVSSEGPTGPDLRVEVDVPRAALGRPQPFAAQIPLIIDGVRRADPHGEGERVPLNLPKAVPEGAVLRLRGLGGVPKGAEAQGPGDLYVTLRLTDAPLPDDPAQALPLMWLLVGCAVLLALVAWALSR